MSYVIYEVESTYILDPERGRHDHRCSYKSIGAAKAAITRGKKKGVVLKDYQIAETEYFHENIEKSIEVSNLMSGKKYMEPVNTPRYMSPACESYWCM